MAGEHRGNNFTFNQDIPEPLEPSQETQEVKQNETTKNPVKNITEKITAEPKQSKEEFDEIAEKQNRDRQLIKLVTFLDGNGAANKWAIFSDVQISEYMGIAVDDVLSIMKDANDWSSGMRYYPIKQSKGYDFNCTFNKSLPDPRIVNKPKPETVIPVAAKLAQPDAKIEPKSQPKEPPFVDGILGIILNHHKKVKMATFAYGLSRIAKNVGCTDREAIDALIFIDMDKSINVTAKMAEYDKSDWIFHIKEGA